MQRGPRILAAASRDAAMSGVGAALKRSSFQRRPESSSCHWIVREREKCVPGGAVLATTEPTPQLVAPPGLWRLAVGHDVRFRIVANRFVRPIRGRLIGDMQPSLAIAPLVERRSERRRGGYRSSQPVGHRSRCEIPPGAEARDETQHDDQRNAAAARRSRNGKRAPHEAPSLTCSRTRPGLRRGQWLACGRSRRAPAACRQRLAAR